MARKAPLVGGLLRTLLVGVDETRKPRRGYAREDGRNRPQGNGVCLAHEAGTDQAESQIRQCSISLEENLTVLQWNKYFNL